MKNPTTLFLCIGLLNMLAATAYGRRITSTYTNMGTGELRYRAAGRDAEAILALGLRNDASSNSLLKDVAAMPVPTEDELKKLLHVRTLKDPPVQDYIDRRIHECRKRYWESSFAAKAALMRNHAADYLNDFVVQLATSNFNWKREIIDDLGYARDPRAVKYLGPLLLDDRTYSAPGSEHAFGRTISEAATDAMGNIIQPPFMDVQKRHPEQFHAFYNDWKMWWRENKDKASDQVFLSKYVNAPPSSGPSTQVNILRQTEKQQSIAIGNDTGNVSGTFDTIQLELPAPNGKLVTVDVTMALATGSNLLWWSAQRADAANGTDKAQRFLSAHKLYVSNDKIGGFSIKGTALVVSEQDDHAMTFDEALKSIIPKIQSTPGAADWLPQSAQALNLWDILGSGFFTSATTFAPPTLMSVSHNGSRWAIQLQNAGNDKAAVVMGSDYKAISATVNGQSVYPK